MSDWLFFLRHSVFFSQIKLDAQWVQEWLLLLFFLFFWQIRCLMYYCQLILTVLATMTMWGFLGVFWAGGIANSPLSCNEKEKLFWTPDTRNCKCIWTFFFLTAIPIISFLCPQTQFYVARESQRSIEERGPTCSVFELYYTVFNTCFSFLTGKYG